jgi:hypothetical protein
MARSLVLAVSDIARGAWPAPPPPTPPKTPEQERAEFLAAQLEAVIRQRVTFYRRRVGGDYWRSTGFRRRVNECGVQAIDFSQINVSTRYRCHCLCHLQMALGSGAPARLVELLI